MGRRPIGERAMTAAERKRRQRQRPHIVTEPDVTKSEPVTKPQPDVTKQELIEARAEIERLRTAATLASLREASLHDEVEKLKAKIVKPAKVPLDPESEAVRQIDALKKKNKTLQKEADRWLRQLRMQMPAAVRIKVAKALTEQTTDPEKRLDALQAWNGLGLNNIGKT